jgi:AbrB family looped-hinge helix DNA binding protein
MKATGIIRRLDDLGRIVIPKEIRRTMGVCEGSPLELFVDTESGGLTLVPYRSEVSSTIKGIAETLNAMEQTPEHWEIAKELNAIAKRLEKLDNE